MREITAPPSEREFHGQVTKARVFLNSVPVTVQVAVYRPSKIDDPNEPQIFTVEVGTLEALMRDLVSLTEQIWQIVRTHKRETGDGTGRPASP